MVPCFTDPAFKINVFGWRSADTWPDERVNHWGRGHASRIDGLIFCILEAFAPVVNPKLSKAVFIIKESGYLTVQFGLFALALSAIYQR